MIEEHLCKAYILFIKERVKSFENEEFKEHIVRLTKKAAF
jgi:hypothetical protein